MYLLFRIIGTVLAEVVYIVWLVASPIVLLPPALGMAPFVAYYGDRQYFRLFIAVLWDLWIRPRATSSVDLVDKHWDWIENGDLKSLVN